jgi:hypothetical protein
MTAYRETFATFGPRYLGRPLAANEGIEEREIEATEARLGIDLPEAMRDYYRITGRCNALNAIHNALIAPDALHFDGEYLVFMDENQSVVSWGLRRADLAEKDPPVWQRNNTPPQAWFSEEMAFSAFMASMFDWYRTQGLWEHAGAE